MTRMPEAVGEINLQGRLGREARYFGKASFDTMAEAFSARAAQHPKFFDTLKKFVEYVHSDKSNIAQELKFNGRRFSANLSERLLGKWVGLAAEKTLLDAKPMPNEADGARSIQLDGEVERLEDAILLAHKGEKTVRINEDILTVIANPNGDTINRMAKAMEDVKDWFKMQDARISLKAAPLVLAGVFLFSNCGGGAIPTPEAPVIPSAALLEAGIHTSTQGGAEIVTGDFSLPTTISNPDCTPGASTQPQIVELTAGANQPGLELAMCSVKAKIGSQGLVDGVVFVELENGVPKQNYLLFTEGDQDQQHGALVPIVDGKVNRTGSGQLRYEITTDSANTPTGVYMVTPDGSGGPYHMDLTGADGSPIPYMLVESLGSVLLHSDISAADATPTSPENTPVPAYHVGIETMIGSQGELLPNQIDVQKQIVEGIPADKLAAEQAYLAAHPEIRGENAGGGGTSGQESFPYGTSSFLVKPENIISIGQDVANPNLYEIVFVHKGGHSNERAIIHVIVDMNITGHMSDAANNPGYTDRMVFGDELAAVLRGEQGVVSIPIFMNDNANAALQNDPVFALVKQIVELRGADLRDLVLFAGGPFQKYVPSEEEYRAWAAAINSIQFIAPQAVTGEGH